MNLITGITDQPKQQSTIILDDGSTVAFYLEYKPAQHGWFYDLTWGTFQITGQRLVSSPNILRQFRDQINWGIAILTNDNQEPLWQDSLVTGSSQIYLMNAADLAAVEAFVYPGQ